MIDFTMYHEAKSKYAYMFDKDTIHLRLFSTKGEVKKVEVIYGDPFLWVPVGNSLDEWTQVIETTDSEMILEYETELYDHFFIALKPKYKRMKYAFIINDQYIYGCREIIDIKKHPKAKTNLFNHFNFPYLNEEDIFNPPVWVEDQIWYSIFPERFNNGDNSIRCNITECSLWRHKAKENNQEDEYLQTNYDRNQLLRNHGQLRKLYRMICLIQMMAVLSATDNINYLRYLAKHKISLFSQQYIPALQR